MTSLAEAPGVLGWGEPAVAQAKMRYGSRKICGGFPVGSPAPAGYVD
jgi:hypothetical protein